LIGSDVLLPAYEKGIYSVSGTNFSSVELDILTIVDAIDLVYTLYAVGVFAFFAYFAYKLTRPRSR